MLLQALDRALEWMDQESHEPVGPGSDSAEAHRGCCGDAHGEPMLDSLGDASAESSWQRAEWEAYVDAMRC